MEPAAEARKPEPADPLARGILFLGLLVGLVRFLRLGEWSLWLDEALTLADSVHGEFLSQKNPLGYALFGAIYRALEERPTEFLLRLPAAVVGWLTLPAIYWAFAARTGRRAAAVAVLLVAASTWHLYWSQMARFYTLAQLLGVVGAGLLVRGFWRDSVVRVLLGVGTIAAGYATHPSAALLLPAIVAGPVISRFTKSPLPGARGRVGILLLVFVAAGTLVGATKVLADLAYWEAVKGVGSPVHLALTGGFYVTPLLGVGALVGAVSVLRRRDPFGVLCLTATLLVAIEALVLSFLVRVSAQYLFVALPWVALLAAQPFRREDGPALRIQLAHLAVLVLPALATVGLYLSVRSGERPRWREAYRYVHNHRGDGDLVLGMDAPVGEYYFSPERTDVRNLTSLSYLDEWRAGIPGKWARYERRTWFVLNREQFEDWDEGGRARVERVLDEECRMVASFPLVVESRDLSVYVYVRD